MLKPSDVSRSRVWVALRVMTSTSPDCRATKRCCAVVGVNLDFSASPNIAAAIALQRSTSSPVHLPWLSENEKPASPVLTAHCTKPLALTASNVLPANAGNDAMDNHAAATRHLVFICQPPVCQSRQHSKARAHSGHAQYRHSIRKELAILGHQHQSF